MTAYLRARRWLARQPFVQRGRVRRYELFLCACDVTIADRLLDVGAGPASLLERFNKTNRIVALDLAGKNAAAFEGLDNVEFVIGDAARMPFDDDSFDVVFSNSLIEHVPRELWLQTAREIRRVGRRYFVQTPNRYFPIEPHYMLPFVQFLPKRLRLRLDRRFCGGEIELLTAHDLRALFPEAEIRRERFLGLTKSLVAIRGLAQ